MRILALVLVAVALAAQPAAAGAHSRATTVSCDGAERRATFRGDMSRRPGASGMQMRFRLRALVDGRWTSVRAPGFQQWRTADAGVERYVHTRTVEQLPAPGAYRVRVAFRWLDAAGYVLARRVRRTPVCRIPDPRPDLAPVSVLARPGGWAVVIRNSGRSGAAPFRVAAAVDGVEQAPREVAGLEEGDEVTVEFDGPCAGRLIVTVDPDDAVEERNEDDNVLEAPCPSPG